MGLASSFWGFGVVFWTIPPEGIIIAFVASRLPRPLPTEILLSLERRLGLPSLRSFFGHRHGVREIQLRGGANDSW